MIKPKPENKILIFSSIWPTATHPYISYLFSGLKAKYPQLNLFLFRLGDLNLAIDLIGKEACHKLKKNLILRFNFTKNPIAYIIPLFYLMRNPIRTFEILRICMDNNYSFYRAIGQLIYFHRLVPKKYDLVYFNSLQIARHICIKAFFKDSKVLCSSRGQDFDFDPESYKNVLRDCDHLHVLGAYLKEKAIREGFNPDKITVIHPATLPIENDKPKAENKSENSGLSLITASRLYWTKGHVFVLRALSILKKKGIGLNLNYKIVGEGPELEFLKFEASRLGISDMVDFCGWKNQNEVNHLVHNSDIYVLLSIEEGFNNSVTQAQTLGKACIVSNTGGLPENVKDQFSGFVIEKYSAQGFADALMNLINKDLLGNFCENAKNNVAGRSLGHQINEFENLFEKVLS